MIKEISKKWAFLIVLALLALNFLLFKIVSASETYFYDDFESYSTGYLSIVGHEIWSPSSGLVVNTNPYQGVWSAMINGSTSGSPTSMIQTEDLRDHIIYEEGDDFKVSWYWRPSRLDNLNGDKLLHINYLDDNSAPLLYVRADGGSYYLSRSVDSELLTDLGPLSIGSYQYISVEFIYGEDITITLNDVSVSVPSVSLGSTPRHIMFLTDQYQTNTCYIDNVRFEVVEEEEENISASLLPPDDSIIDNDDIITITWQNLEREAHTFNLAIYQNDNPDRYFIYSVWANFAYSQWAGLNTPCYSYASESGNGYYGECSFKLSELSPVVGWVEGSDEGLTYDVILSYSLDPTTYQGAVVLVSDWNWHVIGSEWSQVEWDQVSIFPDYYFQSFDEYYDEFGDYDDPLPMIASLGDMFSGTLGQVASMIGTFQNRFDRAEASAFGRSATSGIALIRGYIESFGIFFGGFPIGMFLLTWLAVQAGVVLWRLIKWIISLIPTIG